jgi:hypothetical protein
MLTVQAITLVVGLSYFGLLGTIIFRLKRFVTAEGLNKLSFSESVPVPHGKAVEQYCQQLTRSRALKRLGILYRAMYYGLIANICLFMLTQIIS